jgi:AcrR family transcriptional regulator
MTTASTATLSPRRERARAATIEEIKATALELMREQRTTDVRFTDIARQMGMTPPALYRYFADRDALLTALITDGYDHLGEDVRASQQGIDRADVGGRFLAAAQAYRTWARQEPEQFSLVLGMPVPGYVAEVDGPTTEAAKRAMGQLSALFTDAAELGRLGRPTIREADDSLRDCAHDKHPELDGVLPAESFQAILQAWAGLHGFTSLEAYGHLDWLTPEARDALFLSQVRLIAQASGLPPADGTGSTDG